MLRPAIGGRPTGRLPVVAIVMALATGALTACARHAPAGVEDESRVPIVARGGATAEPREGAALVDADGRAFVVTRIPKTRAVRVDDHTVRGPWSIPLDVVREDAEAYYYKRYASPSSPPATEGREVARATPPPAVTPHGAAERVATRPSDRLRFRSFGSGLPTSGQWRDGFAVADMNEDGHLDIVHGSPRKSFGQPVIFLGDGHGTWRRWSEVRFPTLPYDYGDAQAGDLDGDGHTDIVLAVHLRGLIALLGDGHGGFTNASAGLDFDAGKGGTGFSSRAIRLVDWDGDGRVDVLALGEGPRLALAPGDDRGHVQSAEGVVAYLNRGGRWERHDQGNAHGPLFGESITVADFDGDHHPDVATGSSVFGRTDIVALGTGDGRSVPMAVPIRPQSYVGAVAARDFDGDGRADLVVGYLQRTDTGWRTGIDVLYPRATAPWDRRPLFARDGRDGIVALAAGDLDGDGRGDIVALSGAGETMVFLGDAHGFFTSERAGIPRFPGGCRGSHVELVDLDGDGRDEVIASFAGERSSVANDACPSGGGITAWTTR